MVPSYHSCSLPSGAKIQLVDLPGHERMRASALQHCKGAKGLVFVVDSTSAKSIKQASLLLFAVLTDSRVSPSTPLLV